MPIILSIFLSYMHISWLGSTAMKIQVKPFDKDVTILIDPYKPEKGSFPRSLTADIALYTHGEKDSITVSGNPFVISHPGEWEIKQVLMSATKGHDPKNIIIRFDVEEMSVAHLGRSNKVPTDKQLEMISGVDILFIPVGAEDCLAPEPAAKTVNMIEPRVVIPIAYQSDNDPNAKPVSEFIKEMGAKVEEQEKKVIIKQKDLPQEDTRLIILHKE